MDSTLDDTNGGDRGATGSSEDHRASLVDGAVKLEDTTRDANDQPLKDKRGHHNRQSNKK